MAADSRRTNVSRNPTAGAKPRILRAVDPIPRVLARLTEPQFELVRDVTLLTFETNETGWGPKIEIGCRDLLIGAEVLNFVQTVDTDQPGFLDALQTVPRPNPSLDPDLLHRPFYYDDVQRQEKTNVGVNSVLYHLVFEDKPHRAPAAQPVNKWNAELSWVALMVDEAKYRRLITLSWGFTIKQRNGPVAFVQPRVVAQPSEFHLDAVSKAFRIIK